MGAFSEAIDTLRLNSENLFQLLRQVVRSGGDEKDVIKVLANVLGCDTEQRFDAGGFELKVDLLVDGRLAVEVEFNKRPHEGLHQAIAYSVLLGFESALIHVYEHTPPKYIEIFDKLLNSLNCLNIKGAIIDIEAGDIIVIRNGY